MIQRSRCEGCATKSESGSLNHFRRLPGFQRLRVLVKHWIHAEGRLGQRVAFLLLSEDQTPHASRRAAQVVAHFQLAPLSLVLDLQREVLALLAEQFTLSIAALFWTG